MRVSEFWRPFADRESEAFRAVLDELVESAGFVDYPKNQLMKERSDALAAKWFVRGSETPFLAALPRRERRALHTPTTLLKPA